jgi:uncharacterized YkwD family protein
MKMGFILWTFPVLIMISLLSACQTGNQETVEPNNVDYNPANYGTGEERDDNLYGNRRFDFNYRFNTGRQNTAPNRDDNRYTVPDTEQNQTNNRGGNPDTDNTNNNTGNPDNTDDRVGDYQEKVVELTNQEREKNGLPALKPDSEVMDVAQKKSRDMAKNGYFSHTSPTYGSPFEMLRESGVDFTTAAENIAEGQQSPDAVVDGWMNSSGHRKNIMNKDVTHIGIGYSKDGNYWTQMFIGK